MKMLMIISDRLLGDILVGCVNERFHQCVF